MCGICGVVTFNKKYSPNELDETIRVMTHRLDHRGPDSFGVWKDEKTALGHTRLSIVDLSEHGAQPMRDKSGSELVLTFNGEIYNHATLRKELEQKGHKFNGYCDTEVILRGFKEWGPKVIDRLRGMFAFAIWDPKTQELFLCRDRMGQKPLFYCQTPSGFVFASEIKSLLAWPDVKRIADLSAINSYFTFGFTTGTSTGFKGIFKLKPAHTLTLKTDGSQRIENYWQVPIAQNSTPLKEEELIEELDSRLQEAVDIRKVCDVKVGAFLSGGVDSSGICALMQKGQDQALATFSVGFNHEGYDETDEALKVANHLKTDHHSYKMDDNLLQQLGKMVWHYDMPYADSSSLVSYALSEKIKEKVTVALSGDGADELFFGYPRFQKLYELQQEGGPADNPLNRQRLSSFPDRAPQMADAYMHAIEKLRETQKMEGYEYRLLPTLKNPMSSFGEKYFEQHDNAYLSCSHFYLDSYLPDDILVKMDIASMAHGLEVRSPFLDHKLVEWICSLPVDARLLDGRPKGLLKTTVARYLPEGITERTKMGFHVPISHWFKKELKNFTYKTLIEDPRFEERGLFRPTFVKEMFEAHQNGTEQGSRLWAMLMLELWYQTFIDQDGSTPLDLNLGEYGL